MNGRFDLTLSNAANTGENILVGFVFPHAPRGKREAPKTNGMRHRLFHSLAVIGKLS
jgi:hypothetical protein